MVAEPSRPILKAFAVHQGAYYGMLPSSTPRMNAVKFLGKAQAGERAEGVSASWHESAMTLIGPVPAGGHLTEGEAANGGPAGNGLLLNPWYTVFETVGGDNSVDLWAGRFLDREKPELKTTAIGVFVLYADLPPGELTGQPFVLGLPASRSIILASREDAGDNTQGSNHGGSNDLLINW